MIPSSETLDTTLEEQILRKTSGRIRSLCVEHDLDQITIHGSVETFHIKQLALVAVREIYPSAQICNAIVVD